MSKIVVKKRKSSLRTGEKQVNPGWFKKGQSGNPGGRPRQSNLEKELRRVVGPEWCQQIADILNMKQSELNELIRKYKNKELDTSEYTVLQMKVIELISKAKNFKDLDFIISRVIGKAMARSEVDMQADLTVKDKREIDDRLENKLADVRNKYESDLKKKQEKKNGSG